MIIAQPKHFPPTIYPITARKIAFDVYNHSGRVVEGAFMHTKYEYIC